MMEVETKQIGTELTDIGSLNKFFFLEKSIQLFPEPLDMVVQNFC